MADTPQTDPALWLVPEPRVFDGYICCQFCAYGGFLEFVSAREYPAVKRAWARHYYLMHANRNWSA
jgi:hypothetical protein